MKQIRLFPVPCVLILFLASTGCEEGDTHHAGFTVRDSAGIEIVESSSPLLGPDEVWTISEEPVLQIGEREGEDPYLFQRIPSGIRMAPGGVFGLDDGRIVVCDDGIRSVRVFDSGGRFIFEFGRDGPGPGEFHSDIDGCIRHLSGVAVLERTGASLFDEQGRFLKKIRMEVARGFRIHGVFSDGSLLIRTLSDHEEGSPSLGFHTQGAGVVVQNPDGKPSDWILPVNLYSQITHRVDPIGLLTGSRPFAPAAVIVPVGEEFLYGWSATYELRVFSRNGNLRRVIRLHLGPVPLTKEDREDHPSFFQPVEHYAAFRRVVVDREGHLWVRRIHPGTSWDVLDEAGRWITSLTFPEDVEIHDIGEDYILGVWKDELDVEYVRMYSLDREG